MDANSFSKAIGQALWAIAIIGGLVGILVGAAIVGLLVWIF